jgi:hypothetical protein
MTEEQLTNERAVAMFVKTLRDDLMKVADTGLIPVACFIAFRESSMGEYETIRYIARWTPDCPPGLVKVLDEVLHKWLEQNYDEFIPVSEMSNHKH